MGLFLCNICGEQLKPKHECNTDQLKELVLHLKVRNQELDRATSKLKDRIYNFLVEDTLVNEEGNSIIGRLWDALELQSDYAKTSSEFFRKWIAMHSILSSAFRLFRIKGKVFDSLTHLKKKCDEANEVFRYDSKLVVFPEDIIKEAKAFRLP